MADQFFLKQVNVFMQRLVRYLLIVLIFSANVWTGNSFSLGSIKKEDNKIIINVELFLSSTCPHCHKADAFFKQLETTTPWLHVNRHIIDKDKGALVYFNQLLDNQPRSDFAVPSAFFCNSRWIGFAAAETTGKDLSNALNYCKQQITQKGKLTSASVNVLRHWANANLFDSNMVEHPSVIKYITVMSLVDAFTPCALFCIAGFFAFLFMLNDPKKQMISGLLFLFALGLVHFAQQVYISTFFEWLPWIRWGAALIGLFCFFLAGYRKKLNSKLFYLLAFLLGLVLQAYQQTCLMNWSYVFQQWLHNQAISSVRAAWYQMAYQSLYLAPLIVILILYVSLSRVRHWTKVQQRLHPIGLLYIMTIGLFLIVYPGLLSNLLISLIVVPCVIISGLFLSKFSLPAE